MISPWIGTALLAGSWLFGLDYFYPACHWAWLASVAAGIILLSRTPSPRLSWACSPAVSVAAIVLLLPVVWHSAWPYRAAPLLMLLGLAVPFLPFKRRWTDCFSIGAMAGGVILLAQSLAIELYANQTARSHELFWPFPDLLAGVACLLGADATADGSNVVIYSMRQPHRLGATWELFLDPATFLFLVGGVVSLALTAMRTLPAGERWSAWMRGIRILAIVVVCWLPIRAGLMMAVYLHRVLRSDASRPLHAMNHFFSPWMLLILLAVPVLLAWRFVKGKMEEVRVENTENHKSEIINHKSLATNHWPLATLFAASVFLLTVAVFWNPVGSRREGRVMVVERHSNWEPTQKPYDTTWFGEPSGYNYAAIYDYLGQYCQMSRLLDKDKIDEKTLAGCDVLIIKTPTERYSQAEIDAVLEFVERGGGLLLVGDHTNFERSSTIMNDIARRVGFIFRDDLLFSFNESPYDQRYLPPSPAHPAVKFMPPMDFAVSCSIDPGWSGGRAVVANTGLWSMGPEYHNENFHPVPQHCPEMRCGAFIQSLAARFGHGRVLAFGDSTIFSSFCTFQPGKAELMLGMVDWLNHANPPLNPRFWLIPLGLASLAATLWMSRGNWECWPLPLAAGQFGWTVAALMVVVLHNWQMPLPKPVRPQLKVVIDRTTSTVPLAKGMYAQGGGTGYGMFESWIARLGCVTVRKAGPEAFCGDVLVIISPNRSIPPEFTDRVEKYVAGGGKLLVIDSPENVGSTANTLLWPFGLSINHDRVWQGPLTTGGNLPQVELSGAKEVVGGRSIATIGNYQVGSIARHGKGAVMAVGFGSLWNDKRMGQYAPAGGEETAWMMEPDAKTKAGYDVMFGLLRSFFTDKPLPPAKPKTTEPKKKILEELPLQESGPSEK